MLLSRAAGRVEDSQDRHGLHTTLLSDGVESILRGVVNPVLGYALKLGLVKAGKNV